MSFKVRIAQADRTIEVPSGATILETALDAGISYPFGCQSGNCGACKSHLVKGEVAMEGYSEFALSGEEKASGLILACRAVPRKDSEVAWLEQDDLIAHPRRLLDCRVVGAGRRHARHQAHPAAIVSGGPFDFSAGQFASVTFEGCPPRDYSMGNVPGDPLLEFHVRLTLGRRHQRACRERAEGRRRSGSRARSAPPTCARAIAARSSPLPAARAWRRSSR